MTQWSTRSHFVHINNVHSSNGSDLIKSLIHDCLIFKILFSSWVHDSQISLVLCSWVESIYDSYHWPAKWMTYMSHVIHCSPDELILGLNIWKYYWKFLKHSWQNLIYSIPFALCTIDHIYFIIHLSREILHRSSAGNVCYSK